MMQGKAEQERKAWQKGETDLVVRSQLVKAKRARLRGKHATTSFWPLWAWWQCALPDDVARRLPIAVLAHLDSGIPTVGCGGDTGLLLVRGP